jgi:hypothetical protein
MTGGGEVVNEVNLDNDELYSRSFKSIIVVMDVATSF